METFDGNPWPSTDAAFSDGIRFFSTLRMEISAAETWASTRRKANLPSKNGRLAQGTVLVRF